MLMIEKKFLGITVTSVPMSTYHFDTPMSNSITQQAVGRVRRLGQQHIVKVYEYQVGKSYNCWQMLNNVNKAVPGMTAGLNSNIFKVKILYLTTTQGRGTMLLTLVYLIPEYHHI